MQSVAPRRGRYFGNASCCVAPARRAPDQFHIRVVRRSDNTVGEGIRTTMEYMQLPTVHVAETKPAAATAAAVERDLTRLLVQASLPDAEPKYAAVWSFVRLPAPARTALELNGSERVATAEAEAAQLRERLAEIESLTRRRESPVYSAAAAIGMGWVIVPLALMAYRAVSAHALALADGSISVLPDLGGGLMLLSILAAICLLKRAKARAVSFVLLFLLVELPSRLGLYENEGGSAASDMEGDGGVVLSWAATIMVACVQLRCTVSWLIGWMYPVVLVLALVLSGAYWRLPHQSPRRRRGVMYAMFWGCAIRYLLCWLRTKTFDEDSEYSRVRAVKY